MPSLSIAQNIQIKVFNKTGYNLDSVSFDHFYLGRISKDSSVFLSGIKSKKMKAGIYAFDLFIYETGNEYRLYWKKHE